MSAKQEALPVVPCWVTSVPDVTTREFDRMAEAPSHDALAVPDALWSDEAFRTACGDRWHSDDGAHALFDAIHEELRHRAGRDG